MKSNWQIKISYLTPRPLTPHPCPSPKREGKTVNRLHSVTTNDNWGLPIPRL